jgi:acetyltransferase-like isoleucine patch superfamily enzyme
MKTGLGLRRKIRFIYAKYNCFRFWWRKKLLGFDVANHFIRQVDKVSLKRILSINGAKIGINCDIESGLIFHNCNDYSNLIIGDNCHIGKNCFFDLRDKVTIGDNVVISMNNTIITHIDMTKSGLNNIYPANSAPVLIGNDTYIGANSVVLNGVSIGKYVIVASGSVVNKKVEDRCVVAGVPAKLIKTIASGYNENVCK